MSTFAINRYRTAVGLAGLLLAASVFACGAKADSSAPVMKDTRPKRAADPSDKCYALKGQLACGRDDCQWSMPAERYTANVDNREPLCIPSPEFTARRTCKTESDCKFGEACLLWCDIYENEYSGRGGWPANRGGATFECTPKELP